MCGCSQATGCHLYEFWGWARAVATTVGSRGGQGLHLFVLSRLLVVVAFLAAEHRLEACRLP